MAISHVYDTYAKTTKGTIMHFDVLLDEQNQEKAIQSAKHWLQSIGQGDAAVTSENCYFCHSAEAPLELKNQIETQGYAIYKMEGCPKD